MDGLAGGAFDHVVDGGEDNDGGLAGLFGEADGDVAEVGADDVFEVGEGFADPDEGFVGVGVFVGFEEFVLGDVGVGGLEVDGFEDAPVDGEQVRDEERVDGFAGDEGEGLFDLGLVPVTADQAVGEVGLVLVWEVQQVAWGLACAGGAAGGIDDDGGLFDEAVGQQRRDAECGGGGIAAGVGDEHGPGEMVSIEFGEAVDGFVEVVGVVVWGLVDLFVEFGVGEPVVGGEVDDPQAGVEELWRVGHRGAVREREEDDVGGVGDGGRVDGSAQGEVFIDPAEQGGEGLADVGQLVAVAGEVGELGLGVAQQQIDQVEACVTGGPDDSGSDRHSSLLLPGCGGISNLQNL